MSNRKLTEEKLKSIDGWIENILMSNLAPILIERYSYEELEAATMATVTALRKALIFLESGNTQEASCEPL